MLNYPNCEDKLLDSFKFINEFKNCKSFELEKKNHNITYYRADKPKEQDPDSSKVYSPRQLKKIAKFRLQFKHELD